MIGNKSVLALVTARGGSKGIPGKNILSIEGRPLIQWTIDAARASRYIDRLILSSDDPAIIEVASKGGCEVPFRRAASLATDEAQSIDVVVDALERVRGYDIVVLLQPTSPLRTAADIDGALEVMELRSAQACVSVREAEDHPYGIFRLESPGDYLVRFSEPPAGMSLRRQDLPPAWCINGAVYAARVDWLLRERTFISTLTVAYIMPVERSLDIDTMDDIERLRLTLRATQVDATYCR